MQQVSCVRSRMKRHGVFSLRANKSPSLDERPVVACCSAPEARRLAHRSAAAIHSGWISNTEIGKSDRKRNRLALPACYRSAAMLIPIVAFRLY